MQHSLLVLGAQNEPTCSEDHKVHQQGASLCMTMVEQSFQLVV